jgi:hypothetical protein
VDETAHGQPAYDIKPPVLPSVRVAEPDRDRPEVEVLNVDNSLSPHQSSYLKREELTSTSSPKFQLKRRPSNKSVLSQVSQPATPMSIRSRATSPLPPPNLRPSGPSRESLLSTTLLKQAEAVEPGFRSGSLKVKGGRQNRRRSATVGAPAAPPLPLIEEATESQLAAAPVPSTHKSELSLHDAGMEDAHVATNLLRSPRKAYSRSVGHVYPRIHFSDRASVSKFSRDAESISAAPPIVSSPLRGNSMKYGSSEPINDSREIKSPSSLRAASPEGDEFQPAMPPEVAPIPGFVLRHQKRIQQEQQQQREDSAKKRNSLPEDLDPSQAEQYNQTLSNSANGLNMPALNASGVHLRSIFIEPSQRHREAERNGTPSEHSPNVNPYSTLPRASALLGSPSPNTTVARVAMVRTPSEVSVVAPASHIVEGSRAHSISAVVHHPATNNTTAQTSHVPSHASSVSSPLVAPDHTRLSISDHRVRSVSRSSSRVRDGRSVDVSDV